MNIICYLLGSYPTYEEWKLWDGIKRHIRHIVLILPMRNGNYIKEVDAASFSVVLILPMRNGNEYLLLSNSCILFCSYPTYEEWKLFLIRLKKDGKLVLILPMRNGNDILPPILFFFFFVLILPMRNGNISSYSQTQSQVKCSYPTYEEWKHIYRLLLEDFFYVFLSYLWGMETFPLPVFLYMLWDRSYPTYEEWKPYCPLLFCFLPLFCSYPTYEEWKRSNFSYIDNTILVLILPMRNGNSNISKISICSLASPFLSYLWGMETTRILNKS